MRAREFMTEGRTGSIQSDVSRALPGAWVIPTLKNNDPYLQYRFGVAMAGAKGAKQRDQDNVPEYSKESVFGENEIIVGYGGNIETYIDDALKSMGMPTSDKKQISSPDSLEGTDVVTLSPVRQFKGYPR
jgi:hypothetical protein